MLPQKDINISIPNSEQLLRVAREELFSESDTNTLQPASEDDAQKEIVCPVEESNFEEVFGCNP